MKFFRPRIERFEARQLMASDVEPALSPQLESTSYSISTLDIETATTSAASELDEYVVSNPMVDYFGGAVAARSGSLAVIASRPQSQLVVIDESDAAEPKIAFRIGLGLDFGFQDLKVAGERAIVFGQSTDNHTQVLAIDLAAGKIVNRVELPPGMFSFAHFTGENAWLVLDKAVKPVLAEDGTYASPNDSRLMHFQWSDEGLVNQSSLQVDDGQWAAADNRLIMSHTEFLGGNNHKSTVHLYDISQANLSELATLELENSTTSIAISSDGTRASLITGVVDNPKSLITLLDLSDGTIRVDQSITVEGWTEVYKHDADVAVLTGEGGRELVRVDLRSQTARESRTQVWEIPAGYSLDRGLLTLSDGRLGIPAYVYNGGPFFGETQPATEQLKDGTYVLVADPESTAVQVVRVDESGGRFYSIDPGTNRIGLWSFTGVVSVFIYGELDEQRGFVKQGEISGFFDARQDLPLISADRLLVAGSDQVAIYALNGSGQSLLITSVTESAPALKAADFAIRVPKGGMNLYPIAVDMAWLEQERVRVIALEGAPADVQIANPRMITIAPYEESDRQPVEFVYVISNGISQARGRIHIVYSDDMIPVTVGNEENSSTEQLNVNSSTTRSDITLKHNSLAPLDVNEDGIVTVIDVLQVINAINHGLAQSATGAIDTNGDGMLQAIDVLLVINYLNRELAVASPTIANLSAEELVEIRAIALKAELARAFPQGAPSQNNLLVGLAPPPSPPREFETAVYYTYAETVNQIIQKLEPLPASVLSQTGLGEFNLGSPKLAIYRDGPVQNVTNDQPVNLIKVEYPQDDVSGKIRVEIVHNFGPPEGASVFDYWLRKVDGQWLIVGFEPNYIS